MNALPSKKAPGMLDEARAQALFKHFDMRSSLPRVRVMAMLLSSRRHDEAWTVCDLHRAMVAADYAISLSTVYAALRLFQEQGLMHVIEGKETAYRMQPGAIQALARLRRRACPKTSSEEVLP